MPRQSRLEYHRGGMGSALSNTWRFSRVSTTIRADPHVGYRRNSNEKKKRMNLFPVVCARLSPDPFLPMTPSLPRTRRMGRRDR